MWVLSIKVPIRKKSLETYLMILVCCFLLRKLFSGVYFPAYLTIVKIDYKKKEKNLPKIYLNIFRYSVHHVLSTVCFFFSTHHFLCIFLCFAFSSSRENPYGGVANMLDWDTIVNEFKLQSCYYVHFWTNNLRKSTNSFIISTMG